MCYFSCKAQKIAISRGFNLISNSWWNPRWQPRWRQFLVTSQASSSATTRKMYLILRLSSQDKIVSKYCNISKTPGRGSIPPPPMYYGGGMSLRVRPTINQTSFLAVKTVLSRHSRTFVSTKKIWEEQFGFIVDWKNCRHFSTPPLGSQRNDVWGTSSEIPWERTWERGWNTILMICVVLLINCAARETFFNLSEALLRSG